MRRAPSVLLALISLAAVLLPCQAQDKPLRFGILPDSDSMPFMVAEAEGLFQAQGVKIELVAFASPVERDAAFQAGAVDGVISDIIAAALAVQGGFPVRIVSVTDGRYGVVGEPGGAISMAQLKGKAVGLSTNTIIHYLVDTAAAKAGLENRDITRTAVPKIPIRMELVLGGSVAAAGLPEPFLTVALARGGSLLASSDQYGQDAGIVLFKKEFLDERSGEVAALLKAYWTAAANINAKPDQYRAFLVEKAKFPTEVKDVYRFVTYRKPVLPARDKINDALAWMTKAGLLKTNIDSASLLDDRPLKGW